jgi:hypothetical protein
MSTTAQIAAKQKNAQLSTRPTSPDGKAKSSLNAVKTGLTGRTSCSTEMTTTSAKRKLNLTRPPASTSPLFTKPARRMGTRREWLRIFKRRSRSPRLGDRARSLRRLG